MGVLVMPLFGQISFIVSAVTVFTALSYFVTSCIMCSTGRHAGKSSATPSPGQVDEHGIPWAGGAGGNDAVVIDNDVAGLGRGSMGSGRWGDDFEETSDFAYETDMNPAWTKSVARKSARVYAAATRRFTFGGNEEQVGNVPYER